MHTEASLHATSPLCLVVRLQMADIIITAAGSLSYYQPLQMT
jgi:hypothetical protein